MKANLSYIMPYKLNMEIMMSFREKIAWVSLLSTIAIWGAYAFKAHAIFTTGAGAAPGDGWWIGALTVRTIILTGVVQAILVGVLAARSPGETRLRDERECGFEAQANGIGFVVLNAAVVAVAVLPLALPLAQAALAMAVGIFLAMAIAETARAASLIIAFRRGS